MRGRLARPDVHFSETTLTSYAGAMPLLQFLDERLELPQRLGIAVPTEGRARRYPVHRVLYAFLVGSLLGVAKVAHLEWLRGDAVLEKFVRLAAWPVRKVFSHALEYVTDAGVVALTGLLSNFGLRSIAGRSSVVLDFDSTALRCFGLQEKAAFGYCGKGRNRRRHHPLVGSVAETRAVIHARYRDGSGIDENETIAFMRETVDRTRNAMAGRKVAVRGDSGFWSKAVGAWLLNQAIPFTFSLPLSPGLKLMLMKVSFARVEVLEPCVTAGDEGDDDDPTDEIEVGVLGGGDLGYDPRLRIIVIRRRVADPKAPPPGKVVGWSPDWRYQAIITDRDWEPLDVWRFYNDRGDCERVFKFGKHALGLGWFVSHVFRANEVAFLLRLLAWNADLLFQQDAELRAREEGRPVIRLGVQGRQQYLYRQAGRLLRANNRWELRLAANRRAAATWAFYAAPDASSA
jgi:hypothetical protein